MTRLIVSVRNTEEAHAAWQGGADLLDIKEPKRGSLGRPDWVQVEAILRRLPHEVPVSLAWGELADEASQVTVPSDRLRFVKLGLAGTDRVPDWRERWWRFRDALSTEISIVAVVYAEESAVGAPTAEHVLQLAKDGGAAGVLVDTCDKERGSLFQQWSPQRIQEFIASVHQAGLFVAIAGSLTVETLPLALEMSPDFVAVRGAVCQGSREAALEHRKVREVKSLFRGRVERSSDSTSSEENRLMV